MAKAIDAKKYILYLFVAGASMRSANAIESVKKICSAYLEDNYELTVVDIYQQPELARREQIIAVPTLVKKQPVPLKRFIGDISNTEKVLEGFK